MEMSSLHSHMTSVPYREVDRALMELSAFQHDFTTVRDETKWTQPHAGLSVNLAHEDHRCITCELRGSQDSPIEVLRNAVYLARPSNINSISIPSLLGALIVLYLWYTCLVFSHRPQTDTLRSN